MKDYVPSPARMPNNNNYAVILSREGFFLEKGIAHDKVYSPYAKSYPSSGALKVGFAWQKRNIVLHRLNS